MNALELVSALYSNPLVQWVGVLLAANILTGLASALFSPSTAGFRLGALADWLLSRALPYVLAAGGVQVLFLGVPPEHADKVNVLSSAVWLFCIGSLLGKILQNLSELGVPIPVALTDKDRPEAKVGT